MDSTVVAAIDGLRDMKVVALKRRYLALFGEASKSSNRQYLFRRIAWRPNSIAFGSAKSARTLA